MSSPRLDPGHAGQDEQGQPYQGKHRAPESRSRALVRRVANMVLDQPTSAPQISPDVPGSGSSEVPSDQDAASGQE
jgi:hypothetical protein